MTDPRCADCKFWERRHRSDWTHNQNAYGECQWIGPPIIQFLLDLPVVEEAISNLIGSPRSCHENYSCSMFEPRALSDAERTKVVSQASGQEREKQ